MNDTEIEIDFSNGEITLDSARGKETLASLLARVYTALTQSAALESNDKRTYQLRLDSLRLQDIDVSLSAVFGSRVLKVSIFPPMGLGFEGAESCAVEIARAIASVCPKPVYPMNHYANFPWGELSLSMEWRDGGYGAELSYN
jgi:hypothetical protein